jgi:hypothetical protein
MVMLSAKTTRLTGCTAPQRKLWSSSDNGDAKCSAKEKKKGAPMFYPLLPKNPENQFAKCFEGVADGAKDCKLAPSSSVFALRKGMVVLRTALDEDETSGSVLRHDWLRFRIRTVSVLEPERDK